MPDLPTILPQDSLLAKTNSNTINELFNRNPMSFSDIDLDSIVAFFREKREDWIKEEKAEPKARPKAAPKAVATMADLKALKL